MQPTLKRLLTTKKEPTKKYITALSGSQESFCAEAAGLLRTALAEFETQNAASVQPFMKFLNQIQLVLCAADTNVMLTQFKACLSARPASNALLSDNHPFTVTIRILCDLFFDHAPRAIVRELLRLLSFLMTPAGSAELDAKSVCAITRKEFLSRWNRTLETLDNSASLSLAFTEDGMDEQTFDNMQSSVKNCDLLWSVFLSSVPSLLGLFEEKRSSDIVLCYLVRMMQHVSRDQSQLDFSRHCFSVSTIESLLTSLHGLLKIIAFRAQLEQDIGKLVTACGMEVEALVSKNWDESENHGKLADKAIPNEFDDHYDGDAVRVLGSALNATLGLLLSRNCSKDTTHAAGLLAAFLASEFFLAFGRTHLSWIQSQLVSSFFPTLSTVPSSHLRSALNILTTGSSNNNPFSIYRFSPQFLESLPHPALITLIRGLIICFGPESHILLAPCAALPNSIPHSQSSASSSVKTDSGARDTSSRVVTSSPEPGCILFDALLPWFLKFSETSCERYARFLAVKSAGTCVEFLIKGLNTIEEAPTPTDVGFTAVLRTKVERAMDQLFELIWKNWEDPFDSIVSEIGGIFPLVLDTGEKAYKVFGASSNFGADFTDRLASHLLQVDLATKGKYPLLCMLIQRIGPDRLLHLKPNFLEDLFTASSFALAGRAVGPVINAFIVAVHARTRPPKSNSGKKGQKVESAQASASVKSDSWSVDPIALITAPLTDSLLKQDTLMPITLYALPHILELFPQCLEAVLHLLTPISDGKSNQKYDEARVKAILAILKVGRASGLIDNMDFTKPGFFGSKSAGTDGLLAKLVEESLVSQDINLRLDALQLMVETRKASELPTSMELNALLLNVDHNMLETSLVYRNRSLNLLDQVLLRFKDSIKHHYKLPARTAEAQQSIANDARNAIAYLNEFASTLLHCLYIPAPPHRRFAALEGLKGLVGKFGPDPTKGSNFVPYIDIAFADHANIASQQIKLSESSEEWKKLQLFSPAATLSLLAGLWDQYDAARVLSFDLLKLYPTPLPGFESPEALRPLWRWALASVCSPRMREADSGSLALRLIASSYIVRSGWSLRMKLVPTSVNEVTEYSADLVANLPSGSPTHYIERMVAFCNDIMDIVLVHVAETRKSRKHAAMHFPVHGPMMALRYIINDVNVAPLDEASTKHWRSLVERIMSVANIVSALALELKYPLRYTHNEHGEVDHSQDHDGAGDGEDEDVIQPEEVLSGESDTKSPQAAGSAKKDSLVGGTTEGIIVAMWLSVKEVSFLLGCLVKTSIHAAVTEFSKSHAKKEKQSQVVINSAHPHPSLPLKVISIEEIRSIGQHLLDTLLVLRHRGAMETTSEGFQLICECLLSTTDRQLYSLVSQWLAQLLDRIDNTPWALLSTRRSAGLPYAFIAILRSETIATDRNRISKTMLPLVFAHLLATASRNGWSSQPTLLSVAKELIQSEASSQKGYSPQNIDDADVGRGLHSNHSPKEHRHQVHALNVIRAIIRDRTIIDDIAPYVESVLTLVLNLYHSPHWAVQNSATMAFSTLLERTAGGSKLANMTSASAEENTASAQSPPGGQIAPRVRAPKLTAVDFFARYPVAHSSLISALSKATFTTTNPGFVQLVFKGVIDAQQFPPVLDLLSTIQSLSEGQSMGDSSFAADEKGEQSASSSLYAVLLLLSRMTPSKVASTQRQSHVAPFVLLTCSAALSNSNAMVRGLASKALAPLISTPSMPNFVKSMIDAIPNSLEEYASLMKSFTGQSTIGEANQLHGLLTLILQLLRTHVPILISASQNPNQYVTDIGTFNTTDTTGGSSSSEASFAASCTTQLALLRNSILPSLISKMWLLKTKIAPMTCVLLSILKEFAIQPVCASHSLLSDYPPLSNLFTVTVNLSSLYLKRKLVELAGKGEKTEESSVRLVMEDAMVHRQYKYFADILANALLGLSEQVNLKSAHMNNGSIQDTLETLITFPLYEVRLHVYKLLVQAVGTSKHLNKQTLSKKLLQQVGFLPVSSGVVESHPKCILRIIRLLNMLGEMGALAQLLKESREIVPEKVLAVLQSWSAYEPDAPSTGNPISRYCKTNTVDDTVADTGVSTSLRQEALAFMAFFLKNIQDMYSGDNFHTNYVPMISWWLDMVERHSRYDLATTDRLTAVLSLSRHPLHFSRLPSLPQIQTLVVDYWMLIVRLLQDDDETTRDLARTVVSELRSSSATSLGSLAHQTGPSIPNVHLQPGLMVCTQYCFQYLSSQVPSLPHFWKWLISGLCPTFSSETEKGADFILQYWAKNMAFSTQLFEQEKANFFHEPVLISQLCHASIMKIHQSGRITEEIAASLELTRVQLEQNLTGLIHALALRLPKESSIASMHAEWQTMYDQVFTPLYCLLMGVYTCLKMLPGSPLQSAMIDALVLMNKSGAGKLHPVLSGMTHQLLTSAGHAIDEKDRFIFSTAHGFVSTSPAQSLVTSPADTWHMAARKKCQDTDFLIPRDFN
jgi:hypothetical protein